MESQMLMETTTTRPIHPESYERGRIDGETHARLNTHDNEFIDLKASVAQLVKLTVSLDKSTQSLADGARSSAATAIALATALKEEKDTARETLVAEKQKSETSWNPYGRGMVVLSGLAAALGTVWIVTH
jgi:hypothetical protein